MKRLIDLYKNSASAPDTIANYSIMIVFMGLMVVALV